MNLFKNFNKIINDLRSYQNNKEEVIINSEKWGND